MERTVPGQTPELGSRILRAGAGAGKTTTLVATFMEFVKDHRARHDGAYPKIVITTFTRKATQEVKERLLKKSLELGDDGIFRYLGERSRVHLSTIHGVLAVFLGRYGERVGLPADFTIAGAEELAWLSRRELRRLLVEDESYLPLLEIYDFSELWKALEGWREALTENPGARFFNADEARARVSAHLSRLARQAGAFAAEIPAHSKNEKWHHWAALLADFSRAPAGDREIADYIERVAEADESFGRKPSRAAGKSKLLDEDVADRHKVFLEELWQPIADREQNARFQPGFWKSHDERAALFERLGRSFRERLERARLEKGLLSMADLEHFSLELVRRDPAAAEAFSREWDYWMIDEYQDTSPVQVELLRALVGGKPHFVVGDPQQSIYFFRGARSQVFYDKMKEFTEARVLVEEVSVNRRSRAPLLEFFNDFFAAQTSFSPMEPRSTKPDLPRDVPAADIRIVEKIEERDTSVEAVVEKIQQLIAGGAAPESICVLSRKNEVLKNIQELSRRVGVPVQLHTAGGFAQRREVRDAVAFLRFLLNPADDLNFLSLLRSPWFFMEDADIVPFCGVKGVCYWAEALKRHGDAGTDHPVRRLQAWLDRASAIGLGGTLREFYRREGLLDSAAYADPSGRREANLWKLLMQLENAQREPGFNGLAFAGGLSQGQSTEEGNEDGDAVPAIEPKRVQLMTVHASKGLEFDHVIVTHLHGLRPNEQAKTFMADEADGLWTLADKDLAGKKIASLLARDILEKKNAQLLEESKRVLYVALTRAMQSVTLIWEKPRGKEGRADSRSWASLVPFDLTDGVHDRDKYVYRVEKAEPDLQIWKEDAPETSGLPERWRLEAFEPSREVISPTEILERRVPEHVGRGDTITAQAATRGLRVAQRGTDAHRLFENLKFSSLEEVRDMTDDASLREALQWLHGTTDAPFADLIREGHVEFGFAVRGRSFTLQGQIDLWGVVDGTLWIVDYKTGSREHVEKALDQMAIYAWALKHLRILRDDQPVRLVAVYPLDQSLRIRPFERATDLSAEWSRLLGDGF
ncbi:MAG: UvrD-helicase domain-containing protein [Bdellovibrionaceae bacterium]|nr:UvrD-helicase domain-containing protein [Pseudobdellovibrionaceae bacterium]